MSTVYPSADEPPYSKDEGEPVSCSLKRKVPCAPLHRRGQRIKKKFGPKEYHGTIENVHGSFVSIIYDDGDEEAGDMFNGDLSAVDFVDVPFAKRIKGTLTEKKKTKCLFGLQGLNIHDYQQQQDLIPGISCNHLSLHVLEFYLFTYERQRMWQRKTQNPESTPYSMNERMSLHSFCNIYRELDRGTVFLKASILDLFYSSSDKTQQRRQPRTWNHKEWTKQVLWRSYMYRLVNRVETFENISFAEPTHASLKAFLQRARVYRDQTPVAFFTGAHNVSGFEPYIEAMKQTLKELDAIVDELCVALTSKDKVDVLRKMKLVGDFFAWQILCDMEACGCLTIDFDFCLLGPGAKNGLDLIFRSKANLLKEFKGSEKYLQLARILTALQESAFQILGLEFPYFDGKRLALKEIEHTLCEYNKYSCSNGMHRYRPGEKSAVREDCFSCNGENPEHGYYCDLCNFFSCSKCLENASDFNDYSERSFICPPCRQIESFAAASQV